MKSISRLSEWLVSHKACVNFAVLFISVFSLFLYLSLQINTFSMVFHILSALADASVMTLPFMFLRGRWQYVEVAISVFWGIIVLANVLYYRNFHDLIPGPLYFNNQVGDSLVLNSAMQSLRRSDIIIAVFSFLPLIQLSVCGCSYTTQADRKLMLTGLGVILMISWIGALTGVVRRVHIWNPESKVSAMEIVYPYEALDWISYYRGSNFTGYTIRVLNNGLNRHRELSDDDVSNIRKHLKSRASGQKIHTEHKCPESLVFIVVETLPSAALNRTDTRYVAPVLDALTRDSLTIHVRKCHILIELGQSSDAQFIYNTGLLPLRNNIFVTYYAANDYPAIAKSLKRKSLEIIGEDKSLWSHALTNKSYGYDRIVDMAANNQAMSQDSLILEAATMEISKLKEPFYAFVTTLSMHEPYNAPNVMHKLNADSLADPSLGYREYMERLHHFDESLGRFLQSLKNMGKYDKTCIVITGDHHIRPEAGITGLNDNSVPLIILNSPIQGEYATEAMQLDVFPTILDIMGVDDYEYMGVRYRGLGKSIFSQKPGSGPEMPTDWDYEVSEMIIRRK